VEREIISQFWGGDRWPRLRADRLVQARPSSHVCRGIDAEYAVDPVRMAKSPGVGDQAPVALRNHSNALVELKSLEDRPIKVLANLRGGRAAARNTDVDAAHTKASREECLHVKPMGDSAARGRGAQH